MANTPETTAVRQKPKKTGKAAARAAVPRPIKPIKGIIISFRLTPAEAEALSEAYAKQPIVGVRSRSMLARKLAIDWSGGKLNYKTRKDLLLAPEVNGA